MAVNSSVHNVSQHETLFSNNRTAFQMENSSFFNTSHLNETISYDNIAILQQMNNSTQTMDTFLPVAITWGILAGIAVFENLFVCLLFFLNKTLWTTTNLFVLSLSISDLLCAAVVAPVNILAHYYPSEVAMLVLGYSVGFVLLASVNNLAVVTYNRYLAISHPLKYRIQMTHKKVIALIILIGWTLPLTIDLIPLAWNTDSSTLYNRIYINFYVIGFVLIPCFFMVFGYCKIFIFTRKFIHRSKQRATTGNRTGERAGKELKAARVFAVVFVMFLLCWCPIIMINVADVIGIAAPDWIINISMFTFLMNTLTDPIMFTFFKPDFYVALKRMLPGMQNKPKDTTRSVNIRRTLISRVQLLAKPSTDSSIEKTEEELKKNKPETTEEQQNILLHNDNNEISVEENV